MFTRVLYKTATTLQHYDFVLLSKHILIMWKSPVDFQKLKMLMVLVYLWYKFHFNKNWIFVAIYGIQKSKTKTSFSQNFKSKNIFFKLKIVNYEIIKWKLHMWKTGYCNKRMHLTYKFKVHGPNYQLAQATYTSSYCLLVSSIIVALTIEAVFN